jgi:hypothetical protein
VTDGAKVFRFSGGLACLAEGRALHPATISKINAKKTIARRTGRLNRLDSVFKVPDSFFIFCQCKKAVATDSPL